MFPAAEATADAVLTSMGHLGSDAPADVRPFLEAFALDVVADTLLKVDLKVRVGMDVGRWHVKRVAGGVQDVARMDGARHTMVVVHNG